MKNTSQRRDPALDLVRCTAFVFVVLIHFFKYAEFNSGPVQGGVFYGMIMLRTLASTCVPLFMLLSGYLMHDRKISRSYYAKLSKTLLIYLLASLACALYRKLADNQVLSFQQTIRGILDFTAAPYAWYIEMYIGLFLLIPFLNVLYQNLESKAHKQLLLGVLLFSTALPSVGNIWCFMELEWWRDPTLPVALYKLVPQWWEDLYPLTYYFLGCYLREYPLKLKRSRNLLLLAAAVVLSGSYCYYRSYGTYYTFGLWQNDGSVSVVAMTVLLFILLSGLPVGRAPAGVKRWLARCSDWSLCAYLVSWIFDETVYEILNARIPVIVDRQIWFVVTVPVICLCSLALSAVLTTAAGWILRTARKRNSRTNA